MSAAIRIEAITKLFPSVKNRSGLKEWLVNWKSVHTQKNYYHALDGISFTVEKGECLGIIGRNGAGKSTLLSLLLGTSFPTSGSITVEGKRTPLLELGAGFHPDLTGRENIYINGVLLGLSKKEVRRREHEIIAFSEIENFIDVPVRTYSWGMYLRLAFAIAIHTNPEILLIDEILAVGDGAFQKKSNHALIERIRSGVTTVLVSHQMQEVKEICDRVLWLESGRIRALGNAQDVVKEYEKTFQQI